MDDKRRPINQMLIDLLQSFGVGFIEPDFLPELGREMAAFCGFHVEVADSFLLFDGGVLGIAEGAGFAIAQAGEIILVFAEILGLGSTWMRGYFNLNAQCLFLMTFQTT